MTSLFKKIDKELNVLLNRQRHRRDGSAENFRKFPRGIVEWPSEYFACSCISLARFSQWNKEIAYVTRDEYLQEEFLTDLTMPGFLNHTIYVDIKFLLFAASLLSLLSTMEEVMHLCLFSFTDKIVVFQLIWKILRIEIVKYEAFHFLMRLCS